MSNSAIQAILAEYGNRVKCIKCSGCMIVINYKSSVPSLTTDDIKFVTYGGVDMLKFEQPDGVSGKTNTVLVPSSEVVKIVIAEKENDNIDLYYV